MKDKKILIAFHKKFNMSKVSDIDKNFNIIFRYLLDNCISNNTDLENQSFSNNRKNFYKQKCLCNNKTFDKLFYFNNKINFDKQLNLIQKIFYKNYVFALLKDGGI